VSCFSVIHAGPNKELHMASGGFDNEVKVWKMNGEFTHSVTHSAWVTSLCPFQDSLGGMELVLGDFSSHFCRFPH
jgi:hypothetical protein